MDHDGAFVFVLTQDEFVKSMFKSCACIFSRLDMELDDLPKKRLKELIFEETGSFTPRPQPPSDAAMQQQQAAAAAAAAGAASTGGDEPMQ